eukprot:3730514-Rhodomonas_salina.1
MLQGGSEYSYNWALARNPPRTGLARCLAEVLKACNINDKVVITAFGAAPVTEQSFHVGRRWRGSRLSGFCRGSLTRRGGDSSVMDKGKRKGGESLREAMISNS